MIVILFGAPGVGKGTQAELLANAKSMAHLSTGDAFRLAMKAETELGILARDYVNKGILVPDDIVTGIVQETLSKPEFQGDCILDGFPRTMNQAVALDTLLDELGRSITAVVNIKADNDQIIARMLRRGRPDDTEAVIQHRLTVYDNETLPLLQYYGSSNRLVAVNGNDDIPTVHKHIVEVVDRLNVMR